MNFLTPIFLLGTLAVALPIIFHLIRRTPTLQRPFSSLMFLTPSPPQLSRRSRLDKILLLLLRCLIIGLIAAAFARPFLRDKLPPQSAAAAAKISIVLVDTSASMRRAGLWKGAGDRVREVVRRARPEDRLEIALFDRGVRKLVSFEAWSALSLQERVAAVEQRMRDAAPTWLAGELGSALISAAEELNVLGQSHPSTTRQIIVISDLQEGNRVQNLQGFDWPKGVDVIFETIEAKQRNNAGLHLAVETESGPASSAETRPLVRVSHASDGRRDQFRLSWVDPAGAVAGNPIDLQVLPGKSRIVRAPQRPQNPAQLRLVLSGDEESFDNTLFIAAPEPERVEVAFVGEAAANDPAELLFYLNRAFQETRRRTVRLTPLAGKADVTIPAGVRFVIAAGELAPAEAAAVRKRLEEGGSGLFVAKNAAAAAVIEGLTGVKLRPAREATVKQYAMLEQIDFAHPVFLPFADPRFSDFTKIHFWKHRLIDTNGLPANVRVLARFDDGAPALLEFEAGAGKLLVLASGWYPADSQLALSSKFVPLLYSMLEYAGCFKENISVLLAGAELPQRNPEMSLRKADGTAASLEGGRWVLDTPGFFTATDGAATYTLGVNLDPAESKTAPLDPAELHKLGVPLSNTSQRTAALIEKERKWARATEVESRQKFWRWLIVAALVFVLVETWFAARMSRPVAMESA
jgi:hypothetical protein